MPLLYALVASTSSPPTILAEHAGKKGNYTDYTTRILEKVSEATDGKATYTTDDYTFNYLRLNGLIYLCLATKDLSRSKVFSFLDDIKNRFQAITGDQRVGTAWSLAFNHEFAPVIKRQMELYNSGKVETKMDTVKKQTEEVKGVMLHSVDKVLARGEKIDVMVEKTELLESNASKFQVRSRQLKDQFWWKNFRFYLMCFFLVAAVIFAIVWSLCGASFEKCEAAPSPGSVTPSSGSGSNSSSPSPSPKGLLSSYSTLSVF